MSDIEEPAAKISKIEDTVEGEEMENGQEEWLSEEILTDDDYNPAADQDQSDSTANTSQEEGNTDSMDQVSQDTANTTEENIEQTLNNLESVTSTAQNDLPEELGAFLVRKKDVPVVNTNQQTNNEVESELDESNKQSEDDGNDTDDLLRMLGEDNSKKKEVSAVQRSHNVRQIATQPSSDEENEGYIFEGAKVTRLKVSKDIVRSNENNPKKLKVAKGAMVQNRMASRAVPEDTSDKEADNHVHISKGSTLSKLNTVKSESEEVARSWKLATKAMADDLSDPDGDSMQSSDEAMTVKRMFDVHQTTVVTAGPRGLGRRRRGINAVKTITNRVISIDTKNKVPSVTTAATHNNSASLSAPKLAPKLPAGITIIPTKLKSVASPNGGRAMSDTKVDQDEIDEENQLNDESQDNESDLEEEGGQRLMRPEQMDEEVPSDAESHTDEDSYYDEMPSSESEDADDWFTLDIRAERAADYIPMLGEEAKALLTAEHQRAAARLGALRRSAGALVAGRRALATQLRIARSSLAQLDAALAQ